MVYAIILWAFLWLWYPYVQAIEKQTNKIPIMMLNTY